MLFLVPFSQDKQFVGREDMISDIEEKLETERCVALTGIGGVGYTFRHSHKDRTWLTICSSTADRR